MHIRHKRSLTGPTPFSRAPIGPAQGHYFSSHSSLAVFPRYLVEDTKVGAPGSTLPACSVFLDWLVAR